MTFKNIKNIGNMLTKGAFSYYAPEIARGGLIQILKNKGVDRLVVEDWVNKNVCLWDILGEDYQTKLKLMAQKVGRTDWLTADWVIDALRKDMPVVASLLHPQGWEKANNWLKRQVGIIKEKSYEK